MPKGTGVALWDVRRPDMATHTAEDTTRTTDPVASIPTDLLDGFRFRLCETVEDATRAIEVRRRVYCDGAGYTVPVPDDVDARSWLLMAEEVATGRAVGTVRITPRWAGPLECEEYLELPTRLARPSTIEITRLAILPEHRKTNALVPAVSFGLVRLTYEFSILIGAQAEVVCSKPERAMSYLLMGFRPTGRSASYAKLNGARHDLLWHDFRQASTMVENELFRRLSLGSGFPQVSIPTVAPVLGLAVSEGTYRLAV
jgi:hypothetical protein